ncbi:MAG: 23S rRNA (uracil(1939)-C(5))-methyltransferase RlmD [Bacteroidales bacterium]|jgi:23S rRNA (uracil1939-C5)-methyltransferase|nr:23S rRNA (uracil(1939)-C(5))-methyltransferase RlmD [Bacteroidales bacterium]
MKKKDKIILKDVNIETIAAEGKSLGHVDGKVIFVPGSVPGDVVDVRLCKKRKGYLEGVIVNMIKPSPVRVKPFCPHFGICGGCVWQSIPYEMQLKSKQQQVVDQLTRIGHLDIPEIMPILPSLKTTEFRNKLDFTFSKKRWILSGEDPDGLSDTERLGLGFHVKGMFDKVLDIKTCSLQREPSNKIRLFVKDYAISHGLEFFDLREQTGFLRNLVIRTSSGGETMVIVSFAREDEQARHGLLDAVAEKFPEVTSIYYYINGKANDSTDGLECFHYSGSRYIYESMENIKFRIGPKSFFQTNSGQACRLYDTVRSFCELKGDEVLYDLYTGTGTIALFLSRGVKKVVGIEYVEEAIADAKINAGENNIENASFFAGDMKDILNAGFINENGHPDVIVLDPPRAGIHPDVAKTILEAEPARIVYVSCNPATQARDLEVLSQKYRVDKIRPVDMFPQTAHVENVAALSLRK